MKTGNEYAHALTTFSRIPKAVLAAIAYSFASKIIEDHDSPTMVEAAILDEWLTLHQNGIVPQKPPNDVLYPVAVRS